jgi:hypothetical protein
MTLGKQKILLSRMSISPWLQNSERKLLSTEMTGRSKTTLGELTFGRGFKN